MADSLHHMRYLFAFIISAAFLAQPARAEPITVFAAASLRNVLSEIAQSYPDTVTFSFAGSGKLARQIAAGAPADAAVLAHSDWMSWLKERDQIDGDIQPEIATGRLVLISQKDAAPLPAPDATILMAALEGGRLAMGQRDGVPAGNYAREWLQHIGAWDALAGSLAETDNVRAALALVAMGAAPLGIVYASDAQADPRVKTIYPIPSDAHSAIRYPAAALTDAGQPFVQHLLSPASQSAFAKHGFSQ